VALRLRRRRRGLADRWQNVTPESLRSGGAPFDRSIIVPFCYQSKRSGVGETAFHDVVWYARIFEYASAGDARLLLHFGAVDYRATVWVKGVQVASHEGGHTPFSADVTYTLSGKAARYTKPIFWTETSVPGTVEDRLRWLKDPLELVQRLRSGGLPLVGYTWWPLFSLLDWAYREGVRPPEAYLWHMGMYDLEPDGRGTFLRTETPVVGAFRTATERISER
jgi:hypothetical protein